MTSILTGRVAALKLAASDWLLHYKMASIFELGLAAWGKRRADVVGLSIRGQITVIEVKSDHKDLASDKKWQEYLKACDRFYFCVGYDHWNDRQYDIRQIIKGTTAGVLVLDTNGRCRVSVGARANAIDDKLRFSIICRMAWRHADRNNGKNHRSRRVLPIFGAPVK